MAGPHVLIVYYSESGQTHRLAEALAATLGASLERLEAPDLGSGGWGFARRMWQSLTGANARIAEPSFDPAKFDLVLVGSPVWAGRVASPVRAWLRRFGGRVKTAGAFVSYSKSGAEGALSELNRLMPGRARAELSVSDEERAKGRDEGKLRDFAAAVLAAGAPRAATPPGD